MIKPAVIFLDDGGVLHDNERRGAEWRRLIGEYLAPRLGGEPLAWGEANRAAFDAQWARFQDWSAVHALDEEFVDFFMLGEENSRWLTDMCDAVGVQAPAGAECAALAAATQRFVQSRVQSGFDDAAPAVRVLSEAGFTLATASGETSQELESYLDAIGVRTFINGPFYGPDLVQAHKASPRYYERILADSGVAPADALFVDDNAKAVGWAASTGATTVHMCRQGEPAAAADHVVANLYELVELLGVPLLP